jgi:hypothetical protein
MNLESLFSNTDIASETGLAKTELINDTQISNFELSNIANTEDVSEYLRDTIPQSHLENCPSICYEPIPNELYPNAKGTFSRDSHEICIWGEELAGAEELKATLSHEIGHNVHENMMTNNPELAEKWDNLHQKSFELSQQNGSGFVSEYAKTNVYEDFADSYTAYIGDPEKLQFYNPEKYEFMRDNVFSGQEYSPRLLGGYYLVQEKTYPWSLLDENGEPTVLFCCYESGCCSYDPNGCSP